MNNQPVLTAGTIAGVIMAALAMSVSLGWLKLDDAQMGSIQAFVVAALGFAVPVIGSLIANRFVTSRKNPQTEDGEPGVILPASAVTPEMMAAIAPEKRND